jgi:hypothetical protein
MPAHIEAVSPGYRTAARKGIGAAMAWVRSHKRGINRSRK